MKKLSKILESTWGDIARRAEGDMIRKEDEYHYHPDTQEELMNLVRELIKERGNEADLNDIDVSDITNMVYVFLGTEFNGDISKWDVSNVTDMRCMFQRSKFNGDISNWNVSNVTDMRCMFDRSKFNGDISNWNVSNVKYMDDMFLSCPLKKHPPKWYKE